MPVEIVSVDSALVYRGMDIGTAKPTPAERARVPHHLIDILDPAEAYSAARFVADARAAHRARSARAAGCPLLVGGTMLYFKALYDGLDEMPAADAALRAAIDARGGARRLARAACASWRGVDPATAARLAPNDAQRIQRALEVHAPHRPAAVEPGTARHGPRRQPLPMISLEPRDRAWLHARIAARFRRHARAGPRRRGAGLRARGDLHPGLPSMRCVGYRQAWEALDAGSEALRRLAASAASRPRASSPSASSPGCAACRSAR